MVSEECIILYLCKKACGRIFPTLIERDLHQNSCDGSLISTSEILDLIVKNKAKEN